jgi:hypothetical protein
MGGGRRVGTAGNKSLGRDEEAGAVGAVFKDHGEGARGHEDHAPFSIKHVRIRCKDVNTRANLVRHLGHWK